MKYNYYTYLLVVLVLTSCYQLEKPEQPSTLLSEQEMVNVLTQMSILSAAKGINKRKLEENGILPKDFIFKKYKIDSTVFAENNLYYSHNLESYNRIYNRVKDTLSLLKSKANKKKLKKINANATNKKNAKALENKNPKIISKRDSTIKAGLLKKNQRSRTLK